MTASDIARPAGPHRWRWALAAIVGIAFAARLLFALAMQVDGRANFLLDISLYDLLGRRLASGEGYRGLRGTPFLFFPPGYPAILAALYRTFGTSLVVAWTANAVFGAATCLLVYDVATRLYSRGVGLVAAAIFAIFPGNVFFASLTLSEVAFGVLFVGVLDLLVRWSAGRAAWRWLAIGLLLGVTTLVRGVALPFLAVPALAWTLADGWRAALRRAAIAALGVAVVVLPWTARNYRVTGVPILLATDGALAFFIGHHPAASGTEGGPEVLNARKEWSWLAALPLPEREVEEARLQLRAGVAYVLAHPLDDLLVVPWRLYHLFEHDHSAYHRRPPPAAPVDPKAPRPRRGASPPPVTPAGASGSIDLDTLACTGADAYFFAAVALALVGLPSALRAAHPAAPLVPLTVLYFLVLHGVLFFGSPRYHASLVPLVAILAALGLRRVVDLVRPRRPLAPPGAIHASAP